jgi:AraC-like DNA-binding protein
MKSRYYASVFDESWLRSNPEQLAFTLKNYIQNHFKDDINLNVIAQKLNYSSAWLTKIFCQYYDTTPSRYLMNLRIAQAKNLLAHNHELSIKQIGEMAGYQDQGYFSRIFKKNTGLSPVEYRESLNQRGDPDSHNSSLLMADHLTMVCLFFLSASQRGSRRSETSQQIICSDQTNSVIAYSPRS